MRIEALIFDIGNVLVPFDWRPANAWLRDCCPHLTTDSEKHFKELTARLEIGEMPAERFVRLACRAIGFQGTEQKFVAIWNSIFGSNPPMEKTILGLKERFPLFLLSNTSEIHLTYLNRNYELLGHFVDGVYSFQAKSAKPDKKIFEIAIKQFGLKPENTAYIDDLPINVHSASNLGFQAIQYDLTEHGEFEARLVEMGIQV
jgi:FMN phosphatase YigB (HAD superfamily)